jgi:hypothetical protein
MKKERIISEFRAASRFTESLVTVMLERCGSTQDLCHATTDTEMLNKIADTLIAGRLAEFDPIKFIGKDWRIDPRDEQLPAAPPDITPGSMIFTNMRILGEDILTGGARLRRHRENMNLCLNANHFLRFWYDRDTALQNLGKTEKGEDRHILFDSTVLRDPDNLEMVLFIGLDQGEWYWGCSPIDGHPAEKFESAIAR